MPGTGAYCRSMASNYNHVPRPPVVAVRDGASRVIVRRETEADLLNLDVEMSSVKPPIRLALLGCGTVGSEVVRLLHSQADDLTAPDRRAAGDRRHRRPPSPAGSAAHDRPGAVHSPTRSAWSSGTTWTW